MSLLGSPVRFLTLAAVVVTAQTAVASVPATFSPATSYPTGASGIPQMQAVGDFNGDGVPDAVINDGSQPTVLRLLIGTGNGGFAWPINLNISGACLPNTAPTCASNTFRVIAADVNADGNLDILTANNHSRNLSVVLGNGNGTFQAATNYGIGGEGRAVAVGDLNNDGVLDLIGGDSNSGIRVFIGNGDGTFGAGAWYTDPGINRQAMVVADMDGDGNNDLLVGNRDFGNISVLRGHGDGTLTPWARYPGARGDTLVVDDFNGDGWLDVAAPGPSLTHVAVLLGTGGGVLGPASVYPTSGNWSLFLTSGDFDSDGSTDLVVGNMMSHTVSVLQGDGAGAFGAPTVMPNPTNTSVLHTPGMPAVADFDGDGRVDISVVSSHYRRVVVWLNTTEPASCQAGSYMSGGSCVLAPAGYYVPTEGATSPTACPAGTYSDSPGSVSCTPAPAGSYVPTDGATAPIACAAGYWSNPGATECFAVDSDGDGVNDIDDAYPNSNLSATVAVGACVTGVPNRVLDNGASFNDLLGTAVAGASNHGDRVSSVTELSNSWKAAGLISGRDHGAIVSCTARKK